MVRERSSHCVSSQAVCRDDIQATADLTRRGSRRHLRQVLIRLSPRVHRAATRAIGRRVYRGMPLHVFARQEVRLSCHSLKVTDGTG